MRAENRNNKNPIVDAEALGEDDGKSRIKFSNDIRDIRSIKQLEKVLLDFDSPRLKQAMDDLGVNIKECQKK
jgi:hypothetical protein